jgi:16S rRNA (cytidine1402-2'-O)-methyltransferase
MIGPADESERHAPTVSIRERVAQLVREDHLDEKTALKKAAKERGISKSAAYRELQTLN